MKVLVTGGAGFTGQRVVRALLARGHETRCLVRATTRREPLDGLAVEMVTGDLGSGADLRRALRGTDALMNVASIGFGHGPGIVAAAEAAGVRRALFFSTTAVFTALPAASKRVRLAAESAIRASGLAWTILRPTMIYGAPGDRNVERLLRAIRRYPILPIVGRGERRIQPVLVDDLAKVAVRALESPVAAGKAYQVPGGEAVSFREFVRLAACALSRRIVLVPVPAHAAVAGAGLLNALGVGPAVTPEQVRRLLEDKDFDPGAAARDLGYSPASATEGLALEVSRLWPGRAA